MGKIIGEGITFEKKVADEQTYNRGTKVCNFL